MGDRENQIKRELFALKIELNSFYGVGASESERSRKIFDRVRELRDELKNLNLSNEK
tara:strand:- start:55 stop:225 length:171 start_codon:yes stop_codon:yes gene_type:complete